MEQRTPPALIRPGLRALAAIATAAALGLSACSAPDPTTTDAGHGPGQETSAEEHDHDHHGEDHEDHDHEGEGHDDHDGHDHSGHEETHERAPRIAVATDSGITLLNEDLSEIDSFETTSQAVLNVAHDNRHVLAVNTHDNTVHVLDSGTWAQGHGDHFHFFISDPELVEDSIDGGKPVHVVSNQSAGATAIFFDDEGEAVVLDDEALAHHKVTDLPRITTKGPQHGLAMPLPSDNWLVTQPGPDAGGLPNTIELRNVDDAVENTFECTLMHGEAVAGSTAAFGCSDSILVVADGQANVVANPDDSGERVGGLVANADGSTFLGDWASDSLVFITDGETTLVEVGTEYSNRAVTADGRFTTLGTDGILRIYDADGTETQRFEVTGEWSVPEGHGGVAPFVATADVEGAHVIYVSEPAANKVHRVDLFSNEITSTEVAGQPSSLVVTNAS